MFKEGNFNKENKQKDEDMESPNLQMNEE